MFTNETAGLKHYPEGVSKEDVARGYQVLDQDEPETPAEAEEAGE